MFCYVLSQLINFTLFLNELSLELALFIVVLKVLLAHTLHRSAFISKILDLLVEDLQKLVKIELCLDLLITSLHPLPFRLLERLFLLMNVILPFLLSHPILIRKTSHLLHNLPPHLPISIMDVSLEISKRKLPLLLANIPHLPHQKSIGLLLAPLEEPKDFLQFRLVRDVIKHSIFILGLHDIIGNVVTIGRKLLHIGLVAQLLQDGLAEDVHALPLESLLLLGVDLFEYLLILQVP